MSTPTPSWPNAFHAGEQALQQRVGVHDRMAAIGPQVLRDHMPDQHRELFEKLPTLLLGTLDAQGQPWATSLTGRPVMAAKRGPATPGASSPAARLNQRCTWAWPTGSRGIQALPGA